MNKKTKKTNQEEAVKALMFRVNAVRTVMTLSIKRGYNIGKEHISGLDEHEFISGLLMAVVDATILILNLDRSAPKVLTIEMLIELLKELKDINYEE